MLQGVREERGMGNFSKDLQPADSAALLQYLVSRATELKKALPPPPPPAEDTGNQHE